MSNLRKTVIHELQAAAPERFVKIAFSSVIIDALNSPLKF
jgi:hypothetical protein